MYDILGKLKSVFASEATTTKTPSEPVYESVAPKGDIMEAVRSLEAKFETFKESAKPDFLDVDKDGNKKEPFKKAVKDKKAVKEGAKPDFLDLDKDGDKKEPMKKAAKDKNNAKGAMKDMFGGDAKDLTSKLKIKEGSGPYTLDDPKHPKFKANYEKFKKANPDCKLADFVAAMKKKEKNLSEAAYDEPAPIDSDAVAKRKRLQAIKDRQEDERAARGSDGTNTPIRKVAGKAYGGAAQKDDDSDFKADDKVKKSSIYSVEKAYPGDDDLDEAGYSAKKARAGKDIGKPGKQFSKIAKDAAERYGSKERGEKVAGAVLAKLRANEGEGCVDEVAPPGAKAERMVKHIKAGYADDGKLSKKEKGIAYATAWKAHNKGQVEEGCEFGDTIKNSAPAMKKAKLAKLKESRVMEETDYFYEKVAKALCEKNPHLDTAGSEFEMAVRKEMVAQGIEPNKARNILMMDEDFLMDVASSYGHYCKEVAESMMAPMSSPSTAPVINTEELDEISRLAGLPPTVKPPMMEVSELDEAATRKDFRMVADLIKANPDRAKASELAQHHADIFQKQNPRFKRDMFLNACGIDSLAEVAVDEGNEFTKARLDAIQAGKDSFTVGGKVHSVSGDVSQEKQQVEESIVNETIHNVTIAADGYDALHILQLLSGLQSNESETPVAPTPAAVAPTDAAIGPIEQPEAEVAEERDIEYVNTPNEKIAPLSASTPDGTDLHKSKRQYPGAANRAANPMAVEESLWKDYESLLNDIKA